MIQLSEIHELQTLIDDMAETMKKADGIGLAAPQVGHSIRLILVAQEQKPLVLINPELSNHSFRKEMAEEGCLSIPGVFGTVKRHRRLLWRGYDRNGKKIEGEASGLFARVLQHEVDHIDGILFIDRVKKITHGKLPKKA